MKVAERCPRCTGTVIVHLTFNQRADADTIVANALRIHGESCPSPEPIVRRTTAEQVEPAAAPRQKREPGRCANSPGPLPDLYRRPSNARR